MGNFCKKIGHQEVKKLAQSGHTHYYYRYTSYIVLVDL